MFENLGIFRMSSAMARHAGARQAVVAQNVANADTPGYVARDLPGFEDNFRPNASSQIMRATRSHHLHGVRMAEGLPSVEEVADIAAPNGNAVSLETEILKSVEAKRQHDRALAIYRSSLSLLRSSLRTN